MKKNRLGKLAALTQGAAVVGIGVASVAACNVQPAPQDPTTVTTTNTATNGPTPAPSATEQPGTVAAPGAINAPPAPSSTTRPPSPAQLNAMPPTQPVRSPAQLNAITRGDAGAPVQTGKLPMPNAMPPAADK